MIAMAGVFSGSFIFTELEGRAEKAEQITMGNNK